MFYLLQSNYYQKFVVQLSLIMNQNLALTIISAFLCMPCANSREAVQNCHQYLWYRAGIYNQFINKMSRKEELWRKLRVEVQPCRSPSQASDSPSPAPQPGLANYSCANVPDDEISSPTFVNHKQLRSQVNEKEALTFSFGSNILSQLQLLLKESVNQISEGSIQPIFVQCDSFCVRQDEKFVPATVVRTIMKKLSLFLEEAKLMLSNVKKSLKIYHDGMQNEIMSYKYCLEVIVNNIQLKFNSRRQILQDSIEKLNQQNYFASEKAKIQQRKTQSLEQQLADIIQISLSERANVQNLNRKVTELSEQLDSKIRQNFSLMEQNGNLTSNLKKFMNLATNLVLNSEQQSKSQEVSQTIVLKEKVNDEVADRATKLDKLGKSYLESSVHSNRPKECLCQFKESLQFIDPVNDEQYLSSPVLERYSKPSSRVSFDKSKQSKQAFQLQKQKSGEPNQNQRIKMIGRRNSAASVLPSRKYSWQISTPEPEGKDKNKILQKIQKLKEDIKSEIKDLKMNSL